MTITIYNVFLSKLFQGIDLSTLALRVALLNDQYVPAKNQTTFASISSYEISGSGYVAGGKLLENVTVNELLGADSFILEADDVVWDPSTITAKTIVIYEEVSNDLVTSFLMDANETSENGVFNILWSEEGVLKVSQQVL